MKAKVEHNYYSALGQHSIDVTDIDDSVFLEIDFPERGDCEPRVHDAHDDILEVFQAIEVIYEQREGPLQVFLTK